MNVLRRARHSGAFAWARHSGAHESGEAAEMRTSATPLGVAGNPAPSSSFRGRTGREAGRTEPGIPECLALTRDSHAEIPGSRYAAFGASSRPGMTSVWRAAARYPARKHFFLSPLTISLYGLFSPRPASPRGAIAIVTFAGWDAVDAGDAALRGSWVTSVFGQDGSAPVAGKETAGLRMERPSGQCDGRLHPRRSVLACANPASSE